MRGYPRTIGETSLYGRWSRPFDRRVLYNLPVNSRTRLCLAAILVLSLGMLARAESVSQLQPTGYVNDFAHVLDQIQSRRSTTSAGRSTKRRTRKSPS